ncbi:bile acid:sodium symporter family protein [Gramella sp. GC03-9]|uniref:Bile acid:sodium symporter family protein n=1 Tax=Christiangramia oceanisediminis TaxID=2920386 RepID=A0A9X2KXF4_9FLAO|nr:bile acid:sodium symporter family protein [Gramella oceanisediminis]MCP9199591.1 bile acid:sodium symporter family protein [Gramella oceanisediminis]
MPNLVDIIMPASIAIIMFGIGLELKFSDFKRVFLYPKAILVGLSSQILLLPIIALALIYFWPMDPMYKIGIMLLAACPGGTASNLVTKMLKGRVALSVSMTAFNSFLILFTIPLIIQFSYFIFGSDSRTVNLSFWETMQQITTSVVAPVLAGILIGNLLSESQRTRLHQPLKYILPSMLLVAVVFVIFFDDSTKDVHYLDYIPLFIPLIFFNLISMLAGYFISRKLRLNKDSAYTIAIEIGLQNSVLALYIANQLLEEPDLSLIAILYGSFSLISTFGIAYILKKYFD